MAKQELAVINNFEIVTGFEGMDDDLREELQDAMDDLDDDSGIACRQIKVPSGGGKAFEVESDDPDDPEILKEIEAVIIFTHRMNSFWEGEYGNSDNKVPTCSSFDAKTGINIETGEVKNCETCSLNQYGSDGAGKACKNIRRVYMMLSGRPGVYLLSVPPTSIKEVNKQLARIMGSTKMPYNRMIVRFTMDKAKNKDGIEYSKVLVNLAGKLPEALYEKTAALRKELKAKYTEIAITADDYATTAPKTDAAGFMEVPEGEGEALPFN